MATANGDDDDDDAAAPAGGTSGQSAVEGDIRDLIRSEVLSTRKSETSSSPLLSSQETSRGETSRGENMAPYIRRMGDASIAEIDRLISELQAARNYLQSEGERIQRETARYAHLSQTASASVKVISESLGEWRKAGRSDRDRPSGPGGISGEGTSRF